MFLKSQATTFFVFLSWLDRINRQLNFAARSWPRMQLHRHISIDREWLYLSVLEVWEQVTALCGRKRAIKVGKENSHATGGTCCMANRGHQHYKIEVGYTHPSKPARLFSRAAVSTPRILKRGCGIRALREPAAAVLGGEDGSQGRAREGGSVKVSCPGSHCNWGQNSWMPRGDIQSQPERERFLPERVPGEHLIEPSNAEAPAMQAARQNLFGENLTLNTRGKLSPVPINCQPNSGHLIPWGTAPNTAEQVRPSGHGLSSTKTSSAQEDLSRHIQKSCMRAVR